MIAKMHYDNADGDWIVVEENRWIAQEDTREAARETALEADGITDVRLAWAYAECEECGNIYPYEGELDDGDICYNPDCPSGQMTHLCSPEKTETDREWPDHDHDSNVDYFFEEVLDE